MKSIVMLLSLALNFAPAFAQDQQPAPTPTVAELMRSFGGLFKSINGQVTKNQLTPALEAELDQLAAVAAQSVEIVPGSFDGVPAEEREQLFVAYKAAMQEFIAAIGELKAAVVAQDQAGALAGVKRLVQIRNQSHALFQNPGQGQH
jgi:Cytochrome b562